MRFLALLAAARRRLGKNGRPRRLAAIKFIAVWDSHHRRPLCAASHAAHHCRSGVAERHGAGLDRTGPHCW